MASLRQTLMPMATLIFNPATETPTVVELTQGVTRIGRSEQNDVILHDSSVSSFHAELTLLNDGSLFLKDLNSTQGSFVNGSRIDQVVLKAGDHLMFSCVEAKVAPAHEELGERWKPKLEMLAQAVRAVSSSH